jgi:hypothetical protein
MFCFTDRLFSDEKIDLVNEKNLAYSYSVDFATVYRHINIKY